jgi:hypothetical protein
MIDFCTLKVLRNDTESQLSLNANLSRKAGYSGIMPTALNSEAFLKL